MTVAIDYFLLLGFCFTLASGLFLGLKSIKLI
uniref:Cytochrome b6-f complex subunit 6 n=2 Tax=Fistulifera TaxID=880756 RepID=F3Y7I7_FISSO|nr:cytochrome b6-f complex subunit VI [Fistulifera solaris]YP_010133894.1 subunit VI of cytochrome b6/f complex [Fistulifera saprophila]QWM93384.1 subunit VI of cytochrome b6/f complex [Fistulifera saprophila]BAK19032.1 cytochrome b6-f complex subunit VI [Fistulifera solaris]